MKKTFALLSSLKLAVVLLVVLLVGLSVGTIIESQAGVEVAQSVVYYAWWFLALEALLGVNVLCSIVAHFPWGNQRIGYLLTHASIIVILAGAMVTYFFTQEGQLALWEGQSGNVVENIAPDGKHTHIDLPFNVTLDDFRIDHYEGTMRPANFASRVRIADPATGKEFPVEIWMNHEFTHQGYTLFQSSYQQDNGREASVFRVAKDPGQPIVFVGYFLLVFGMCVVLATRIVQRRQATQAQSVLSGLGVKAAAALLAISLGGSALAAAPADVDALRRLPVQHDGRQMPFDTVAREVVWNVTGAKDWNGEQPAATVTRWMEDTRAAAAEPVIKVGSSELAQALGHAGRSHVAFTQLVDNAAASSIFGQVQAAQQREQPRRGVLADAEKLLDRAQWMQRILNQDLVRPIPVPGQPRAKWNVAPEQTVSNLVALSKGQRLPGWKTTAQVEQELTYNAVAPSHVSWIVLAISLVLAIVGGRTKKRAVDVAAFVALLAGFGVMTWGIGMRWAVAERIPAANMYESLLFLAWGVGLFAVVAFAFIRNRLLVVNAAAGATITMMLTDLLPIDAFIHPIPPVLAGTPWLAIHVPIIMVSYSVLALGVIIAHAQVVFSALGPKKAQLVEKMSDLNYWYMFVGSILLIVGIMTGSMWAAESWGRYWGWDPKEVWSLVAWLAYMAILHGRVDRMFGQFGVAVLSILAFQTILMTYLGVNYVLGTGLHSYGFGDSPIATWMLVVALAEAIFLSWGYLAYRRHAPASGGGAAPASA
jgi:cytochrome c-type biogenesis protein CcsB